MGNHQRRPHGLSAPRHTHTPTRADSSLVGINQTASVVQHRKAGTRASHRKAGTRASRPTFHAARPLMRYFICFVRHLTEANISLDFQRNNAIQTKFEVRNEVKIRTQPPAQILSVITDLSAHLYRRLRHTEQHTAIFLTTSHPRQYSSTILVQVRCSTPCS